MSRRDDDAEATTLHVTPASASNDPGLEATRADTASDASDALRPGSMLGRYKLVARLGAGAMGVVWSATDPQLDRTIAIKVVHPSLARTAEASVRLRREARAMAKVSHRGVVTVHDAGDADGQLFLAMELVDGTTLGHMLRTRSADERADWSRWLALVVEAGAGLAAAHREGVLHRDFKPDNVLVERGGRVCVADFGLASLGDTVAPEPPRRDSVTLLDLTTTGTLLGTPAYMGPQQLRGEPVDARADQFSFCVACWEAIYGERPFAAAERAPGAIAAMLDAIEAGAIGEPPAGSRVPPAIRDVLRRGLAADPDARWPSMDRLLDELQLASSPHPARGRATRRTRLWLAMLAIAALAAAAIAIAVVATARSDPTPPAVATTAGSPPSGPARPEPKRLFGVTLRTRIALAPNGKRIAFGGSAIEVRDLEGPGYWSTPLTQYVDVSHLEIDHDTVRFGRKNKATVWAWQYMTEPTFSLEATGTGWWFGRTVRGELNFHYGPPRAIALVDGAREVARWPVQSNIEILRISPDRTRVAYIDGLRFAERLIVRDVVADRVIVSQPIDALTALAWRDASTLLYATGTILRPQIHQVTVTATGLGTSQPVFGLDTGWFGELAAHDDRLFFVEMGLSSRARVIERSTLVGHDFDSATVAGPLAWLGPNEFLSWNRSSQRVERRTSTAPVATTSIILDGEPANATLAGDILIAALRRDGGRFTIAYSLSDDKPRWQHDDLETLAVRCVDDQRPPCFALRSHANGQRVQRIDPTTGELGETVHDAERLEDIAVHPDGKRLIVAAADKPCLYALELASGTRTPISVPLGTARSVAFDPTGGLLVAGTLARNNYQAARIDESGTYTVIANTENDLLSLIRASPGGDRVLVLSRQYAPALWQVALPPR